MQCFPPTASFEGDSGPEQDHAALAPQQSHHIPENYGTQTTYGYGPAPFPDTYPSYTPLSEPPLVQQYPSSSSRSVQSPDSGYITTPTASRYPGQPYMSDLTTQFSQGPSNYTVAPLHSSTNDAAPKTEPDQLASALVNLNITNDAVGNDAVGMIFLFSHKAIRDHADRFRSQVHQRGVKAAWGRNTCRYG